MNDLAPMDVGSRAPRLRASLDAAGCDALLVTRLVNIRYLTGFSGSAALLLVLPDEMLFVSDGRYQEQSALELAAAGVEARIEIGFSGGAQKASLQSAAGGIVRLGLEAEDLSWAQQRRYDQDWFPRAELVPTSGLVEALRLTKDDGEIARMAEAARIADLALEVVVPRLAERPTEREVALALDHEMRRNGASASAFDTIVASGPNGAKPHHQPSSRMIEPGELVVIDFGAVVDGYCSDMTRTVCVGEPASATARRMVAVVAESQQAGVDAVAAGVGASKVDQVCRAVIEKAGWADAFLHGTGHGVGLEIHEAPRVAYTSDETLQVGHVVTVEPGVYLPDEGGVRIEDTLVVTPDGCRRLTNAPKELVVA